MKRSIPARTFAAVCLTAVLVLAGACSSGSDDDASDDETTTTESSSEDTTADTMTDDEFVGEIDELTSQIDAASGDLCAIVVVGQEAGPASSPSTPAQVESLLNAQASMLRALAAVEPVDEANAAILNDYADRLLAAGEAAGFSVEFLSGEELMELQSDEALTPAIGAYQERAASECPELGAGAADGGETPTEGAETPEAP